MVCDRQALLTLTVRPLQRSQLEQELSEKAEEIRVLKDRYETLETKHTDTREELIVKREHLATLTKQVLIQALVIPRIIAINL